MGARASPTVTRGNQHRLFEDGGERGRMATEPAGVSETVPRETSGTVSPDGKESAGPRRRPEPDPLLLRADEENTELKLWAARYAWKRQYQLTPSGVTWRQWFERIFGEDLMEFREAQRAKKKIRCTD